MTLVSWMYISRSLLPPEQRDAELAKIVSQSNSRNQAHLLTGSLVFTGARFAQYLEGPPEHVTKLRNLILSDPRHTDIFVVEERARDRRCFEHWSMAFLGSSWRYVAKAVERPLQADPGDLRMAIDALQRLMIEFSSQARS